MKKTKLWQCNSCRRISEVKLNTTKKKCEHCGGAEWLSHKKCRGVCHPPGGEQVLLAEFSFLKSGPLEGRPLSRCRKCRSMERAKSVPQEVYWPVIQWLKNQGMTQRDIAKAIGTSDSSISFWALKRTKWMRHDYFLRFWKLKNKIILEKSKHLAQGRLDDSSNQVLEL